MPGRFLTLVALALPVAAAFAGPASRSDFVVREAGGGGVLMGGDVTLMLRGDRITRDLVYRAADGSTLQTEHAVYRSADLRLIEYHLRNSVLGLDSDEIADGGVLREHYRDGATGEFKDRTQPWGADDFHPGVLDALALRRLDALRAQRTLPFELVIHQLGHSIGMELAYEGERQLQGEPVAAVLLRPRFALFRAMMPRVEYCYAPGAEPYLRQFVGPSPFPGSRQQVEILYQRPRAVDDAPD